MDLKQRTQVVLDTIKELKTQWVAANPLDTDLASYLYFFRGDEMIAWVQSPMDAQVSLNAARLGAVAFSASTIAVAHEGYHSTHKTSPVTGKPWGIGEKQFIYTSDPMASEKNLVDSCISISCHERGGAWLWGVLPYRIRQMELIWLEDRGKITYSEDEEVVESGGGMHDALQEVMTMPTTEELLHKAAEENPVMALFRDHLTLENREYHADVAAREALLSKELAMAVQLFAEPGSDRDRWLTERFGEPGT